MSVSQFIGHFPLRTLLNLIKCIIIYLESMFYAIYLPPECEEERPDVCDLVFDDLKSASLALKKYKGSRMKTFSSRERALDFLTDPAQDVSFLDLDSSACSDFVSSFERLSLQNNHQQTSSPQKSQPNNQHYSPLRQQPSQSNSIPLPPPPQPPPVQSDEPVYPSVKPAFLNQLRRKIESGDYEGVTETINSNPRCLATVCDSAVYLMAGPKYNACHIAARANKADIMALILDTISKNSFLKKLYPDETDANIKDRVSHLLDSYLNTRDPKLGNTPLHFACKLGHQDVVRVLLTFEECDRSLRDSNGKTAEESTCVQYNGCESSHLTSEIKNLFKQPLPTPLARDKLKKRLLLERRRRTSSQADSDTSFSDLDSSFIFGTPTKQNVAQ